VINLGSHGSIIAVIVLSGITDVVQTTKHLVCSYSTPIRKAYPRRLDGRLRASTVWLLTRFSRNCSRDWLRYRFQSLFS